MTSHVRVDCVGCVNPGAELMQTISAENKRKVDGTVEVLKESDEFVLILASGRRDSGGKKSDGELYVRPCALCHV